jgi:hypothetical protein
VFLLTHIKITDVKAQFKNTEMPQFYSFYQGNAEFRDFRVVPEGMYYSLEHHGNKFAVLNKKTCSAFQEALSGRQVHLRAYVQSKEWLNAHKLWQKNKNSTILTVEINVYGAQEVADEVGNVLSSSGTFLQQPRYGLDGIAYYNPHYFRLPGFSDAASLYTPITTIQDTTPAPIQNAERDRSDASVEVASILDSLSHHDFLKERVADVRIRRPLLPCVFHRTFSQVQVELIWFN